MTSSNDVTDDAIFVGLLRLSHSLLGDRRTALHDAAADSLQPTHNKLHGWLGSRVVSMLDSGAEGPEFKSQSRRRQVTVLSKLFTPIVPLFTT